ncbi:MAG: 2-C-methyl-D-erythritol 4-phosphate cytidylyltransferase [Peptoniphilaceae bacterium]|nr:2-C-methyl-D-erythritol 4-phosphate cytidylyltransferase [Peptoniphilaceae bacterium]
MTKQKIAAIISAAGKGERMGFHRNKLLIPLGGMTILERTLIALEAMEEIEHFILVIRPEDEAVIRSFLPSIFSDLTRIQLVYGGKTRQESTRNGLFAISESADLVMIHDGARPFITHKVVRDCIQRLLESDAEGAIAVVPMKDTIKVVNEKGLVVATPQRSMLCAVQTPQVFYRKKLMDAYQKGAREEINATDDAQLMVYLGGKIVTSPGDYSNIKMTTPEDLLVGRLIIEKRQQETL